MRIGAKGVGHYELFAMTIQNVDSDISYQTLRSDFERSEIIWTPYWALLSWEHITVTLN
jgi:hypothetical protein